MTPGRRIVVALVVVSAVAGSAYWAGRRSAPARIEEREKIVERGGERQVQAKQAEARRDVHRERVVVRKPDGTVTETTVVDAHAGSKASEVTVAERVVERQVEVERLVVAQPPAPRLRLWAGVEAQQLAPHVVVGAELRLTPSLLGVAPWLYASVEPPGLLSNRSGAEWRAGLKLQGEW